MNKLYTFNNHRMRLPSTDVSRYMMLERFTNASVAFSDRSGLLQIPFRMQTAKACMLPAYDADFSLSYEDCAQARVSEIIAIQDRINKPIVLLYSGGIDSSLVLTSFIKQIGIDGCKDRIKIAMSQSGITENPWMWERFIRPSHIEIINSEAHDTMGQDNIIISGEFNDQLHGSDMFRSLIEWKGPSILKTRWTPDLIREYLLFKNMADLADFWTQRLVAVIQNAPCPIDTMADFWWWVNFCCKWNTVYWRTLLFTRDPSYLSEQWLDEQYFHFFGSSLFQQWSMFDREHKHDGNWLTYKWHARDIVADFVGQEYQFKTKAGSLWELMTAKKKAAAIDIGMKTYYDIDPAQWYNPNNSFI